MAKRQAKSIGVTDLPSISAARPHTEASGQPAPRGSGKTNISPIDVLALIQDDLSQYPEKVVLARNGSIFILLRPPTKVDYLSFNDNTGEFLFNSVPVVRAKQ